MTLCWFRFHLSTAVLLMVAAGGLIWANVIKRVDIAPPKIYWCTNFSYGFPLKASVATTRFYNARTMGTDDMKRALQEIENVERQTIAIEGEGFFLVPLAENYKLELPGVIVNVIFALVVLSLVAFLSESLIRRRKNPEQKSS